MYALFTRLIARGLEKQVPATGLGIFRILFGLVIFQEVCFLMYFRHLVFEATPYLEPASPALFNLLIAWAVIAACLVLGYKTRLMAVINYAFWVVFVMFTPMNQDFDGGFDQLMTSSSFLLMFLPSERALSLDNLRLKIHNWAPGQRFEPNHQVTVLAYFLPLLLSLGLVYTDSAIHKLWAEHWRNGMGAWLPSSHPYYMSPVDMSWLLENKPAQMATAYTIIVFQFVFPFLLYFRPFRLPLMAVGMSLHIGILFSFNIYPFGFGMLVHYALMTPFSVWRRLAGWVRAKEPRLTVFYDEQCPLCNRTVLTLEHFDIRRSVDYKGLQTHRLDYRELDGIPEQELLHDLYALDRKGRLYAGVDTYSRTFRAMSYLAPIGWLMSLPGLHQVAQRVYRRIADNRARLACDETCVAPGRGDSGKGDSRIAPTLDGPLQGLLTRYAGTPAQQTASIAKLLVLVTILQLNSTIHYGFLYRFGVKTAGTPLGAISHEMIGLSHAFLGITPHALYVHDHFAGYEHIIGITYRDPAGKEQWLPFFDKEGRIIAPNWGRVHSFWANIAITRHPNRERLYRCARKITAFWGKELGMDFKNMDFTVKMKEIGMPSSWEPGLRAHNLAAPWRDIGHISWRDGFMRLDIDGVELESL
jgi:predicted DCC family thiol-disulfide oxidoreductase YuxK